MDVGRKVDLRPRINNARTQALLVFLVLVLVLLLGTPRSIEIVDRHLALEQCLLTSNQIGTIFKQVDMVPRDSQLASYIERIEHCRTTKTGKGLILINTRDTLSRAVFRVRLAGPEVHIVPIRYHSGKLHYGEYSVGRPGEYYVEVMMLYASFNETQITSSVIPDIKTTWVSALPLLDTAKSSLNPSGDALCNSDVTWVVGPEFAEYVRRTRTWAQDLWPAGHHLIHQVLPGPNVTGLRFESNCRAIDPLIMYNPLYGDCIKLSKVCMWGDSQMRHLYDIIVAALFQNSEASIQNKEVLDGHGYINFFSKTYDNFEQDMDRLVQSGDCSVVIANFGQHPAGWLYGYPWPFDKYKIYAEADILYLKQLAEKHTGLRPFWMTTHPHGFAGYGMLANEEWRTYPVLDRYNGIAMQLARTHGIETLDTYRIVKL